MSRVVSYEFAVITAVPDPEHPTEDLPAEGNLANGGLWWIQDGGGPWGQDGVWHEGGPITTAAKILERMPEKRWWIFPNRERKFFAKIMTEAMEKVFEPGEVLILNVDTGREVGGRGRKPCKWFVEYEVFATLEMALRRSYEILGSTDIPEFKGMEEVER